jgi:hypothetical protein
MRSVQEQHKMVRDMQNMTATAGRGVGYILDYKVYGERTGYEGIHVTPAIFLSTV